MFGRRLLGELRGLVDLLLPPACPLCGERFGEGEGPFFCSVCLAGFTPARSPRCPHCALPYPAEGVPDHPCEDCTREPPPFRWVRALGLYEGHLREAVHRFKYRGDMDFDRPLGRLLALTLASDLRDFAPQLILPVPLHRDRLAGRTYNQALLLARVLGRALEIPVPSSLLLRHRSTPSQQGLDATERQRNLRGAFGLGRSLEGERVLLLDDVMTTGATARECARVLLAGGASEVAVAVLGRARRHRWEAETPCPSLD